MASSPCPSPLRGGRARRAVGVARSLGDQSGWHTFVGVAPRAHGLWRGPVTVTTGAAVLGSQSGGSKFLQPGIFGGCASGGRIGRWSATGVHVLETFYVARRLTVAGEPVVSYQPAPLRPAPSGSPGCDTGVTPRRRSGREDGRAGVAPTSAKPALETGGVSFIGRCAVATGVSQARRRRCLSRKD